MSDKKNKVITITLIRSTIGVKKSHRETVRGLGLRKINSSSTLNDTAEVRGMIRKVDYLLKQN
ncbi:MAG TPA: 50S ribosomal protein L30 [Nitrosomonas sp.]|nr:50S ribosomal protein L30 [Nitrosomonas sp.]HQX13159.1 50S ribosomal protein L30 [Nitrosomonas sp.]HRB32651.1 50S ribosomal protein L30 [Nitrosomonas sp.]HRB45050.1 50S ribosomal protein L30 [Nitrosomonas sp.]HRB77409.1 50S ribosomal protein L30 [Nitrosomonas sp.]